MAQPSRLSADLLGLGVEKGAAAPDVDTVLPLPAEPASASMPAQPEPAAPPPEPEPTRGTVAFTMRLPPDLHEELRQQAFFERRPMQAIITEAIRHRPRRRT